MPLLACLEAFFRRQAPLDPGDGLLLAFSGGPDSTALLQGLRRLSRRRGVRLVAAHLDHGLDPGSAGRARRAAALAAGLGIEVHVEHRAVDRLSLPGESPEAAARRVRYAFLEEARFRHRARWIATAHHRDDQIETVLLRLLFGSGLGGLAAMPAVQGKIARPVLEISRSELHRSLEGPPTEAPSAPSERTTPVADPTNEDLRRPRNLLRHRLLPVLETHDPAIGEALLRLAGAARGARERIEAALSPLLKIEDLEGGAGVDRRALESLPKDLLPFALGLPHRRAGASYPPRRAARLELERQLAGGSPVGCDCGDGWRWESRRSPGGEERIATVRERAEVVQDRAAALNFTYTFKAPGEIEILELGARIRLRRGPWAPWMLRGDTARAGLALPLTEGGRVTVRNRLPGDRLRPLGAAGRRRLKEILIDQGIPRHQRDRIPLLCVGDRIAWVPGVTIEDDFRLCGEGEVWLAEILPPAPALSPGLAGNPAPAESVD